MAFLVVNQNGRLQTQILMNYARAHVFVHLFQGFHTGKHAIHVMTSILQPLLQLPQQMMRVITHLTMAAFYAYR